MIAPQRAGNYIKRPILCVRGTPLQGPVLGLRVQGWDGGLSLVTEVGLGTTQPWIPASGFIDLPRSACVCR